MVTAKTAHEMPIFSLVLEVYLHFGARLEKKTTTLRMVKCVPKLTLLDKKLKKS